MNGGAKPLVIDSVLPPLPIATPPVIIDAENNSDLKEAEKDSDTLEAAFLWLVWLWGLFDYLQFVALTGGIPARLPDDYLAFTGHLTWANLWTPLFAMTTPAVPVEKGEGFAKFSPVFGVHSHDLFLTNVVNALLFLALVILLFVGVLVACVFTGRVDHNKASFGEGVMDCLACVLVRAGSFVFTGLLCSAMFELSSGHRAFNLSLASLALVGLAVFAGGCLFAIIRQRDMLTSRQTFVRLGGWYWQFHPKSYWFQGIVLIKKTLLVTSVVVFQENAASTAQLSFLLVVLGIYVIMIGAIRPFSHPLQLVVEGVVTFVCIFHVALLLSFTPITSVRREDGSLNAVTWLAIAVELFTMAFYLAAVTLNFAHWCRRPNKSSLLDNAINAEGEDSEALRDPPASCYEGSDYEDDVEDDQAPRSVLREATFPEGGDTDVVELLTRSLTHDPPEREQLRFVSSDLRLNLTGVREGFSVDHEALRKSEKIAEYRAKLSNVDGRDFLYVGSDSVASQLPLLKEHRITHVLNTIGDLMDNPFPEDLQYLKLYLRDGTDEDIACVFYDTIEFIEQCEAEGGRVLIHCQVGSSRSVTLAMAWLMLREGLSDEEALERVRQARAIARPNIGFICQLLEWRERLDRGPRAPIFYKIEQQSGAAASILVARIQHDPPVPPLQEDVVYLVHLPSSKGVAWMGTSASPAHCRMLSVLAARLQRYEHLAPGPLEMCADAADFCARAV